MAHFFQQALSNCASKLGIVRDPVFEVTSINFDGFKVRFSSPVLAVIDAKLLLSIKVNNPNIVPIEYTSSIMDVYYHGTLLGQAKVDEGGQGQQSTETIRCPAELDSVEVTSHVKDLIQDVIKRQMTLQAIVTIAGVAKVLNWKHHFKVHVKSDVKVDPVFLNVIEQENKVHVEMDPIPA